MLYIYIQFDPHVIHTVQLLGATKAAEPPDQSIKVNPHGYNGRFELRFVNDMADANQTKFILKWFTFDSSLVFHQWMPVLHASLDSRSQQLSDGAGQSMMAKFLFNEFQFPSILGTVLLFLFTYVSPHWQMWDPIEVTLTPEKKNMHGMTLGSAQERSNLPFWRHRTPDRKWSWDGWGSMVYWEQVKKDEETANI